MYINHSIKYSPFIIYVIEINKIKYDLFNLSIVL